MNRGKKHGRGRFENLHESGQKKAAKSRKSHRSPCVSGTVGRTARRISERLSEVLRGELLKAAYLGRRRGHAVGGWSQAWAPEKSLVDFKILGPPNHSECLFPYL